MPGKRRGPPRENIVEFPGKNASSTKRSQKSRDKSANAKRSKKNGGGKGGGGGGKKPPEYVLTANTAAKDMIPPANLSAKGKEIYRLFRDCLAKRGAAWLDPSMNEALASAAELTAIATRAREALWREQEALLDFGGNLTVEGAHGKKGNPAYRIVQSAEKAAAEAREPFGLDAWNKARIEAELGLQEVENNPFGEMAN